ncbi:LysR family transcriptional regulator [Roseateles sp. YR242]|uniref:LysR family transcriptional regulator n=1 Tax=Roseateles sp. YR242 TaxID=1855305 RepID=UPI000B812049|nr:LysR family transcriptional regulator [Roseateles sp. YR242]
MQDRDLLPAAGTVDRIALLHTFVRIVQAGSLSAAASQLGSTPPTISRRLQALERELGVNLLQRSSRGLSLTEDGERCHALAQELLADWDAFESELRGQRDAPRGTLRVVAPHAFGQSVLIDAVAGFLSNHPRVSIDWLLHDRTPDFIADNIDCAIHAGEVTDPSLIALRVADVPRIAVVAPDLLRGAPVPQQADELAALPWIAQSTFYRDELLLTHAHTGETRRVPLRVRFSTDNLFALHGAALRGVGACVGSEWVMRPDIAAGRLVQLAPQWQAAPLPIHLVYPRSRHMPARMRHFLDAMREALPAALVAAV